MGRKILQMDTSNFMFDPVSTQMATSREDPTASIIKLDLKTIILCIPE